VYICVKTSIGLVYSVLGLLIKREESAVISIVVLSYVLNIDTYLPTYISLLEIITGKEIYWLLVIILNTDVRLRVCGYSVSYNELNKIYFVL
jgi:hypothetical protein